MFKKKLFYRRPHLSVENFTNKLLKWQLGRRWGFNIKSFLLNQIQYLNRSLKQLIEPYLSPTSGTRERSEYLTHVWKDRLCIGVSQKPETPTNRCLKRSEIDAAE